MRMSRARSIYENRDNRNWNSQCDYCWWLPCKFLLFFY